MKFFRPSSPKPTTSVSSSAPRPGFGQVRAQKLEKRLQKATRERQKLVRAEAGAQPPIKDVLAQRGEMVGRRIGHLQQELKENDE